ncbi:Peptide hydrolase [Mycena sanguinolenta]|uniref:Peptide hydrolase n=1 Tax=Mycena sanguinolenta TaxID=230812 RepID=A0A8H6ZB29_9AGAR|nr:Peptide hydrolase [Mycena sanguinolenta]
MTRSELSPHSPRVVRKAFRAEAASKAEGKKVEKPMGIVRRNPGRMDGVQWNGDSFVCARQVDGDTPNAEVEDEGTRTEAGSDEQRPRDEPMVISLLDIARPAKRRGLAKKYQIVPRIGRVIEIEDGTQSEQWEDWERESDLWDVQSEQWETQSEVWEIPSGDYGAEEWEELYGEKFEQAARSSFATVVSAQR